MPLICNIVRENTILPHQDKSGPFYHLLSFYKTCNSHKSSYEHPIRLISEAKQIKQRLSGSVNWFLDMHIRVSLTK